MPSGVYQRSEAHKRALRERLALVTKRSIDLGIQGKYVRTQAHRDAFRARIGASPRGEKSSNWKGDTVGYSGVHKWMKVIYGTPSECESCGTNKAGRFDWANISGKYLRERSDWKRLCRSCHMKADGRGARAVMAMYAAFSKKIGRANG